MFFEVFLQVKAVHLFSHSTNTAHPSTPITHGEGKKRGGTAARSQNRSDKFWSDTKHVEWRQLSRRRVEKKYVFFLSLTEICVLWCNF